MTTIGKKKRRRLLLFLPFLLILSACRIDTSITVGEDGSASLSIAFDNEDPSTKFVGCNSLASQLESLKSTYGTPAIESVPGAKGLGCKFTFKDGPFVKTLSEKDAEGHVTVTIPKEFWSAMDGQLKGAARSGMSNLKFKFAITLPSEVTKVSEGGMINGNTAEWDSYDKVKKGISATAGGELGDTGEAEPDDSPTTDDETTSPSPETTSPDKTSPGSPTPWASPKKDEGMPTWVWFAIAIGAGVLVAVITVVILVSRRKSDGGFPGSDGYPGPGGGFPGPGGYPGSDGYPGGGSYPGAGGGYPGTDGYSGPGGGYPGSDGYTGGGNYSATGGYLGPGGGYQSPGGQAGFGQQQYQGQSAGEAFAGLQSAQSAGQAGPANPFQPPSSAQTTPYPEHHQTTP